MSRQRFIALVVAALLVVSGAFYLSARRNTQDAPGIALFPALAADMNSVTAVSVRKGGPTPTVTIHKNGARWTVMERGDYPADIGKLRKLLSSLRDAKIVEEKTADPARYVEIGVDDPTQPSSAGIDVSITAPPDQFDLIVGKPVGEGNFVRRPADKQSYSVEPALSLETEPRYWIDARLIDLPAASIRSIEVKPATGAGYALRRSSAEAPFSLDGAPPGRKALDGSALAPAPSTFAGLDAQDVAAAGEIDFGQSSQATVTMTDGNVLTLTGTVIGTKHWLSVKASKDPMLITKTEGRAFEVASYRYDEIFKPLEQLLVPKESAPAKVTAPANAAKKVSQAAPAPR